MDLRPNEQQTMLRDSARRFLDDAYDFDARRRHLSAGGDALWPTIAELGWTGAALPERVGGLGGSTAELAMLMEEMGRSLYVGPFLTTAIGASILEAAGGADADALLAEISAGQARVALAFGEPGGRGFFDKAKTVVERVDGAPQLRGRKRLVHDAASAQRFIVSATDGEGQGLYLVEASSAKVVRRDYRTLDNGFASDIEFDGAPAIELAVGAAADAALERAFHTAAVGLGAEAVGIAEAALKVTRAYVAGRQQFGRVLSDFQVIQHRLSDMFVEIEQLKAMVLHALAAEHDSAEERHSAALGLKVLAGQVAVKVAGDGLHLHGGMGMTDEMPISHYYRRAKVLDAQYGNADYCLARYARRMT